MNRNEAYASAQHHFEHDQHALARALWHRYATLRPDDLAAHRGLTFSYVTTNEYLNAERHAQMWRLLEPNQPQAHWLYGQLLQINQRPEADVLREFLKLEQLAPNWQGLHLPLAKIYFGRRKTDLAASYFERALQSYNGDEAMLNTIKWEYAMMLLTLGDYKRGWLYHEARLQRFGKPGLNLAPLPAPVWQGEYLKGKTIVVHGEQGIGDEIMYASMLNDLSERGANIVLACYPPLAPVMQHSFPHIHVVSHRRGLTEMQEWQHNIMPQWWRELKKIDYQIPMGSLAHQLRPNKHSFPRTAYLTPESGLQDKQKTLLQKQAEAQGISLAGKQLIGLAWCGNLDNPHGRAKSIELHQLAHLADVVHEQNIVFISLQNRQYGAQATEQSTLPIIDMSSYTDEFADTLALASLCQHIITIDTSYFHLCAAAGLPVTLLLRRNCDWRFGWTSTDCDWYPNVSIIRQSKDLDWHDATRELQNKIQQGLTKRI